MGLFNKSNTAGAQTDGQKAEQATKKPAFAIGKKSATNSLKQSLAGAGNSQVAKTATEPETPGSAEVLAEPASEVGAIIGDVPPVAPTSEIQDGKYDFENQPEGLPEGAVQTMKDNLEILKSTIDHPEMVADAIKMILQHMQSHPQLKEMLQDEDYGNMVLALRTSYGTTLVTKQKSAGKRAASSAKVEETLDLLGEMELTL